MEACQRLLAATDDGEVLRAVVEQAAALLRADDVRLALLDYEPEWMVIRQAVGWASALVGQRLHSNVGLLGQTLQKGTVFRLDAAREPDSAPGLGATIGPALVLPLRFKGELLGALQAARPSGALPFSGEDEQALEILVGMAAARLGASTQGAALRARAQELTALDPAWRPPLEQAGDFVLVVKNRRELIDVDAAACRVLDYSREALLQRVLSDLVPLPPWADKVDNLGGIREQMLRETITFDSIIRRRDGTMIPVMMHLRAFRQPDGFVTRGVFRDLSHEKRAQAQTMQSEKMRLLQEIGSGLAHEVNTPLAVVIGNVEMALAETNNADLQVMLQAARSAGQRIADTIQSIHRFAKPITPTAWTTLDLSQLAWETVEACRGLWEGEARADQPEIRVECATPPMPPVRGDERELREALRELLVNAVQAMPQGGTIRVESEATEEQVSLCVRDDGVGMTPEVQQFCLSPFFTTHRPQASGLGLTRVYHTALRHRGQLQVDSTEGLGTCVTLSLPRTPAD